MPRMTFKAVLTYFRRKEAKRQNEVIVSIRHDEPLTKVTDLMEWCMEHHCYPEYIKDEVKARMPQRISIQCPSRAIQTLAKLTWGGQ